MCTKKIIAIAGILVAVWRGQAQAQIPVIDVANLGMNTTTALQQTLNTIEALLHTGYWILELTELAELATDDEFLNDLAILQDLAREVQTISWDVRSVAQQIQQLYGVGSAPTTSRELYFKQQEMRKVTQEAWAYAVKTQSLLRTIVNTVDHIKRLVSKIAALVGNRAALQNINDAVTALTKVEVNQAAVTATWARAQALEAMEKTVIEESSRKVQKNFCGRWCR